MSEVDCPVGGCEYSGEPKSVEAHISSSTTGGHSGKSGSEHRHELEEGGSTEETGGEGEPESPDADADLGDEGMPEQEPEGESEGSGAGGMLLIGLVLLAVLLSGQSSGSNRGGV